jgi:hypothetical protein
MNIEVELDIFSGRPNPSWVLRPEESKELIQLITALPAHQFKTSSDDALGYRGFLVKIEPEENDIALRRTRVFHGFIVNLDTKKVYQDVHGLEKWLFKQAVMRGYGAFIDSI